MNSIISNFLLISLTCLLGMSSLNAQTFNTYTSFRDGAIQEPGTWSTDGGITSCNCTPTLEYSTISLISKGNVVISHKVTMQKNTLMTGNTTSILITNGGSLKGNFSNLEIRGGRVTNNGELAVADLIINFRSRLYTNSFLVVGSGNLTVGSTGGLQVSGTMMIPQGKLINQGIVNLTAGINTVFIGSELENNNRMNIQQGACLNLDMTLENAGTVDIYGGRTPAHLQLNGDLINTGTWSPKVSWCAFGADAGMPFPENCSNNCQQASAPSTTGDSFTENEVATVLAPDSFEPKMAFQAYPNPFQGTLHLQAMGQSDQAVELVMRNLNGEVVFQDQWQPTSGSSTLSISTDELNTGMYILSITHEGTNEYRKLLHQ